MSLLIQIKAIFISIFVLFFGLLPACLLAIPFPLRIRLKIVSPIWNLGSQLMLRLGCKAQIDISEDHRSQPFKQVPPPGLYISNHQSFIDIPLVLTKYQAPPIMKKEVLYIPVFGLLGWVSGALPVSRSKLNSRKKVFEKAKERIVNKQIGVHVYPEGTRSKNAVPKPYQDIKKTLLFFAFEENIPVIPTSLYGTRGVLSQKGTINPGKHLGVIVHQEIWPKDFSDADTFARAVWDKVIQGHQEMSLRLAPLNQN